MQPKTTPIEKKYIKIQYPKITHVYLVKIYLVYTHLTTIYWVHKCTTEIG